MRYAQWYLAANNTELWLVTDDGQLLKTAHPGAYPTNRKVVVR